MSIKAVMNNPDTSYSLNLAFPNIEPILRPEMSGSAYEK